MRVGRRGVLAAVAAILAGGAWWGLRRGDDEVVAALRRSFGDAVADHPEAARFARDLEARLSRGRPAHVTLRQSIGLIGEVPDPAFADTLEEIVVVLFVEGSNVVLASEQGLELEYLGMRDPYGAPCTNPVGALALEAI
jgi:hypothetical protein